MVRSRRAAGPPCRAGLADEGYAMGATLTIQNALLSRADEVIE